MIKEAASYVSDENIDINIDDVVEFIGDAVPPLVSLACMSTTRSESKAQCEMPYIVIELLGKVIEWIKKK